MDLTSIEEIAYACNKAARAFREAGLSFEEAAALLTAAIDVDEAKMWAISKNASDAQKAGNAISSLLVSGYHHTSFDIFSIMRRRAEAHVRRWYSR